MKPEHEPNNLTIERAKPEDAETICDIRDRAWLEAYPNPDLGITVEDVRLMAQGPGGEYVPRRIAYLKNEYAKLEDASEVTFVAKQGETILGFVSPRIDEHDRRRIGAIYVAPETQGQGIGSKLLQHALDFHGRDQDIYLEVVSYNQNAINFYRRFGFEPTNAIVPPEHGRPDYLKQLPFTEMVLRAKADS